MDQHRPLFPKRTFMDVFMDVWLPVIGGLSVACLVLLFVALIVILLGYLIGLWSAPCAMDSSQPSCIAHGWGTGITLHGSLHR